MKSIIKKPFNKPIIPIDQFVKKFAEAVEIKDASSLSADTEFRNLDGWSSLASLSVFVLLEEEFGFRMGVQEFQKLKTIQEVYDACTKNKKI